MGLGGIVADGLDGKVRVDVLGQCQKQVLNLPDYGGCTYEVCAAHALL